METLIDILRRAGNFFGSTWGIVLLMVAGFALLSWQIRRQQKTPQTSGESVQPCPDERLHEIAEGERTNINKVVWVHKCELRYQGLDNDMPYVDFDFNILNGSVHSISIENPLEGYIKFDGQPLVGEVKIHSGSIYHCGHGEEVRLTVRQALNEKAATSIRDKKGYFDFSQLQIMIKGADPDQDIHPRRLMLMQKIDKNGTPV